MPHVIITAVLLNRYARKTLVAEKVSPHFPVSLMTWTMRNIDAREVTAFVHRSLSITISYSPFCQVSLISLFPLSSPIPSLPMHAALSVELHVASFFSAIASVLCVPFVQISNKGRAIHYLFGVYVLYSVF